VYVVPPSFHTHFRLQTILWFPLIHLASFLFFRL
jgi:hypothetical protein